MARSSLKRDPRLGGEHVQERPRRPGDAAPVRAVVRSLDHTANLIEREGPADAPAVRAGFEGGRSGGDPPKRGPSHKPSA